MARQCPFFCWNFRTTHNMTLKCKMCPFVSIVNRIVRHIQKYTLGDPLTIKWDTLSNEMQLSFLYHHFSACFKVWRYTCRQKDKKDKSWKDIAGKKEYIKTSFLDRYRQYFIMCPFFHVSWLFCIACELCIGYKT